MSKKSSKALPWRKPPQKSSKKKVGIGLASAAVAAGTAVLTRKKRK